MRYSNTNGKFQYIVNFIFVLYAFYNICFMLITLCYMHGVFMIN